MVIEMKDIQDKIKSYLLRNERCKKFGFNDNTGVEFLAQGEYNKNFVIYHNHKKFVFRINTGSQLNLDNQIEYEYNVIKTLEKSGVTPRGYFVDDSRSFFEQGILMMNFLEGNPLNYRTDLLKAAEIFSKIHTLDIEAFQKILISEKALCNDRVKEGERWLEPYMNSDIAPLESQRLLERLLEFCRNNVGRDAYFMDDPWLVVNNTEVNSHNFIIGNEKNYLIDWEKPVISDPVQDLTQFLVPTTTLWKANYILDKNQISGFYKAYMKGQQQNYDIIERVELYKPFLYLRAFSWCAGAWVEYTNQSRTIKNDDTFTKIKMYLEPDFMKKILGAYIK